MREHFGIVMERTIAELRGEACIDLERPEPRQQIIASRSFGAPVYSLDELAETVREYMTRAVAKLRAQQSVAGAVGVWIQTNQFRSQDPQYHPSAVVTVSMPTDDIAELTSFATHILRGLYRTGFRYAKSGVMLVDLSEKAVQQGDLFASQQPVRANREKLLEVIDKANCRWGRDTLGLGHTGIQGPRRWAMRRGNVSPAYTTRWDELPVVH